MKKVIRLAVLISFVVLAILTVTLTASAAALKPQAITVKNGASGTITVTAGKSVSLGAKARTALSYQSSNSSIVKVSQKGKITAKGMGKSIITITAAQANGYSGATMKIIVDVKRREQKIIVNSISLKEGKSITRQVKGLKTTFSVTSKDPSIASVSRTGSQIFKVTGLKAGTGRIIVAAKESTIYAAKTCIINITVTASEKHTQDSAAQTTAVSQATTNTDIRLIAPKMDSRVLNAFIQIGFRVDIDPSYFVSGRTMIAKKQIILRKADETIYHELGHFLFFLAGRQDNDEELLSVFKEEIDHFPGSNRLYASQNIEEYYGECTREFVLRPQALKNACPGTYECIEKDLGKINDQRIAAVRIFLNKLH